MYNQGLTAGAYLSVIGLAKNLRPATDSTHYYFQWNGPLDGNGNPNGPGTLAFFNETSYPGQLPEPVTLVGPADGTLLGPEGDVFSCEVSENAIQYRFLVGSDPYRVMDYTLISVTATPPTELTSLSMLPADATYWTIKAVDAYGSTIYADPVQFNQARMDFNGDGYTNLLDFGVVTTHWLETGCQPVQWCGGTDVTFDGSVGLADLQGFLDLWLVRRDWTLVGHWALNETSGLVATHASANGLNGTLMNFPVDDSQWVSGYNGGALAFDGTDDYVEVFGYKGVLGTESRTVSAWIKTSTTGEIVSWGTNVAPGRKWILRVQDDNGSAGAIRAEVASGYIVGTTDVRDGLWHHVAAVLTDDGSPDVTEIALYVDGSLETVSTSKPRAINTASGDNVKIGVFAQSSRYFNGLIDDVRIYNRALSLSEIQTLE